MLKSLWHKLRPASQKKSFKPIILKRDEHHVSRKDINKNALKILYRLNEAGYQAFLVGGGVRDILLGLHPKDFDIATDATPEQIHQLFRNSRIIGRRFRLVHIMFGRDVIEVATFRASHQESCSKNAKTSEQGLLVRDNVFGNLEEDAFRRDFTVNALYYTVQDFSVLDHTGGLEDLQKRQLRLIGDPLERYREDPVRILRAIRLSCKLDLKIESKTAEPIEQLAPLLEHISAARLWEESNKLLLAGYAYQTWHRLIEYDVARHLFPATLKALSNDQSSQFSRFIDQALNSTDKRIEQQLPVTPAFLFAVFLWQPLLNEIQRLIEKGLPAYEARQKAANQIFAEQVNFIAIPKRFSITAREIWSLQFRLHNRKKRSVESLLNHPKFRAAYDFLCLRADGDEQLITLAKWWTDYQTANTAQREELLSQANDKHTQSSKRRKKYSANKKRTHAKKPLKKRKPPQ